MSGVKTAKYSELLYCSELLYYNATDYGVVNLNTGETEVKLCILP